MEYLLLPEVKKDKTLSFNHFPNAFYAAVFRLWETVPKKQIATALNVSEETIDVTAEELGLPPQKYTDLWAERGYITTIRNSWHLLPYEQLLDLLGWTEEKLATVLKEDDFLEIKLGGFKPYCKTVKPEPLNEYQKEQLSHIKDIMKNHFSDMFSGTKPFDFFKDVDFYENEEQNDGLRMVFSYCGLYANALDKDISISFPESLLKMYQATGVNAIWLPAVLYQLVPFSFDESYSKGWEQRQKRLQELVKLAKSYGINVFLYLNEPRCMPLKFFKTHPHLQGRTDERYASLCTSTPEVMEYLKSSVYSLCEAVPDIGGFFVITCSENLTHCKSSTEGKPCKRCEDVPTDKLIADVLCAISEESRKINPKIKTIAWTWEWENYMTEEEIFSCIDRLPKEVILQCNSESRKEFSVGGVTRTVDEYSMSVPGPGPIFEKISKYAKEKGHEVCAKVQVNVSWECSTLPFLPVFDLIREHMTNLRNIGVRHLMLSWTLGGYPSVNLKIASASMQQDSEKAYQQVLSEEYGEYADDIKAAASIFSEAFRQFPFAIKNLYFGPQNAGPSNLLYETKTDFQATMTCYSYDDLGEWCDTYPQDIYINQLLKLSTRWKEGLDLLKQVPDCDFVQAAYGGYTLFYSSYLQADFIANRDSGNVSRLREIVEEEKNLALLMYALMQKNNTIGYEAANHYYFNKGMLAEKVINCEYLSKKYSAK